MDLDSFSYLDVGLSLLSLTLLISTLTLGLAYLNADQERTEWKEKALDRQSTIQDKNFKINNLEDNVEIQSQTIEKLNNSLYTAELFAGAPTWYEVGNDRYFFDLYVYNFGDREAQNIELQCGIKDSQYDPVNYSFTKENIGNIASESSEWVNFDVKLNTTVDEEDVAVCEISDCKSCRMLKNEIWSLRNMFS